MLGGAGRRAAADPRDRHARRAGAGRRISTHLPYVNPDAPKGGRLALAYLGAFDSLNPYNVKALSTAQGLVGNVYQSLMTRSADEPFTLYGLIARSIETDDARDRVVFHLDPAAHFSDGAKIIAADVLFTFNLLKTKGLPSQRAAYALVKTRRRARRPDRAFRSRRRQRPRTAADPRDDAGARRAPTPTPRISRTRRLQIPVASGPYRVAEVEPGQRLVLRRDPNYWARDLPINARPLQFRRDPHRLLSATLRRCSKPSRPGWYDFRLEDDPTRWRDGYDFPAARDGRVLR